MSTKVENMNERLQLVLRELSGTIEQIAKSLGVSHATLYKYLAGKTKPNADFLIQLKAQTGVNLNWFFTGEGEIYGDSNFDGVDHVLLRMILNSVFDFLSNTKREISNEEKTILVDSIYRMIKKENIPINQNNKDAQNRINELISFKYS